MYEVKANDIAKLPIQQDGIENAGFAAPTPKRELSVRSKKPKAGERVNKGDGSVVLVRSIKFFWGVTRGLLT
jgi:nuclear pore complex protein Nup133